METPTLNNWPDNVRLKMIERSEFYGDSGRVYQYGYYDGYNRRNEVVSEMLEALIEAEKALTHEYWMTGESAAVIRAAIDKSPHIIKIRAAIKKATE